MTKARSDYITVTYPGKKKVDVAARRIGTKDRMAVIATCNTEEAADKIVTSLNALQGEVDRLSAPALSQLEMAKARFAKEHQRYVENETKHRDERSKLQQQIYKLEAELRTAQRESYKLRRQAEDTQATVRNVSRENTAALMKG